MQVLLRPLHVSKAVNVRVRLWLQPVTRSVPPSQVTFTEPHSFVALGAVAVAHVGMDDGLQSRSVVDPQPLFGRNTGVVTTFQV